jgi:hypothetical protein
VLLKSTTNQQGGRFAAASVEPCIPAGEFVLELVPGLLDGVVLADDPVVLLDPDIALFNFTAPLASLQWVAADTPDGLVAEGLVVGGGELVCAPATRIPDARNNAAPNSLFDIAFLLGWASRYLRGQAEQLIARPSDNLGGRIKLRPEFKIVPDMVTRP